VNISDVGSVTLSLGSNWQVNLAPDDEYAVLIPENLATGRHKLTVKVKDSSGMVLCEDEMYFCWENHHDGFGMGLFNLGSG